MNLRRQGFTLIEVMVATIILSVGLVVLLTSFMNCQRVMMASQDLETAQYVLTLGETAHPMPSPDQVTATRSKTTNCSVSGRPPPRTS